MKPRKYQKTTRRRRFVTAEKKECRFCKGNNIEIDYKNISLLKDFVSSTGKILSRRITGTCAKHQRRVSRAIKLARILALLPFTVY